MYLRFSRREEAVGDVDGDALLALGGKSVDEKREIDPLTLRAMAFAVGLERRKLVVEDLLGVVQQPPDQGRLAVVDAAAGDEAQQLLAFLGLEPFGDIGGRAVQKVALLFLLLHARRARVAVDRPALSFGRGRDQHFGDDLLDGRRAALDRSCQRIAAERPEAHAAHGRLLAAFSGIRSSSTIRMSPSRSTTGRSAAK